MFVAGGARVSVDVALPIGPLEESVSVTSAATGVLPSQTGAPVTVLDAKTLELLGKTDVLEALRLVPGSSLVETGAKGGGTSIFIRGGNSNFNKVLIDGIPANDIGGGHRSRRSSRWPAWSALKCCAKPTASSPGPMRWPA